MTIRLAGAFMALALIGCDSLEVPQCYSDRDCAPTGQCRGGACAPTPSLTVTVTGEGSVRSSPPGIDCGASCVATFEQGAMVTLTATVAGTSRFAQWSGACTGQGATCTLEMTEDRVTSAAFVPNRHTVVVTTDGDGTVTSVPDGLSCGTECAAEFEHGTSVELTAAPEGSLQFALWGGECSGRQNTCRLTVERSMAVIARFRVDPQYVQVAVVGDGTVSSLDGNLACPDACESAYERGDTLTLVARAGAHYHLGDWTGDCAGSRSMCALTVDGARSTTVTFAIDRHRLTVSTVGSGSVRSAPAGVDCGAACDAEFDYGTAVTLSAIPESGHAFTAWAGACTGAGDCVVTMDAAKTVSAAFEPVVEPQALTVTVDGAGRVVSAPAGLDCPGTCTFGFAKDSQVTLTPTPTASSRFDGWSGDCAGSMACNVTMDAAKSVTATFVPTQALTVMVTGDGRVTSAPMGIDCPGTCNQTFDDGQMVTLTATPEADRVFQSWSGDCSGSMACVVTMDVARSVTATFVPTHVLTVAVTGDGQVTSAPMGIDCPVTCNQAFVQGEMVTLTATPDADRVFQGWNGDCSGSMACVVTMDAARSVTATFVQTYALTVTVTGGGRVTSSPAGIDCPGACNQAFVDGEMVTLTATPDGGGTFDGWSGACSGLGGCVLTMSQARSVVAEFSSSGCAADLCETGDVAANGTMPMSGADLTTGGWTANGGGNESITYSDAQAHSGTLSVRTSGYNGAGGQLAFGATTSLTTSVWYRAEEARADSFRVAAATGYIEIQTQNFCTSNAPFMYSFVDGAGMSQVGVPIPGSPAYAAGVWYRFEIQVVDTSVTVTVSDGNTTGVASFSMSSPLSLDRARIRVDCCGQCSHTAYWDDFELTDTSVPSGLIAHWRLDGDGEDATGNGHAGALTGGGYVEGVSGQALRLSASGAGLRVPFAASLALRDALTFSAWINVDDPNAGEQQIFSGAQTGAGADPWEFTLAGGNLVLRLEGSGGGASAASTGGLAAGTWHHVAGTYDRALGSDQARVYIDGELAGSATFSEQLLELDHDASIGALLPSLSSTLIGRIDDLRVWGRALTAAEIRAQALPCFGSAFSASAQTLGSSYEGAAADVDGDGDTDVVGFVDGVTSRLYRNDGAGRFTESTISSVSHFRLVLADVNQDGAPDIVHNRNNAGGGRILLNDGNGNFSDAGIEIGGPSRPEFEYYGIFPADVDGDGDVDLVTQANGGFHVFRNDLVPTAVLGFTRITATIFGAGYNNPRATLIDANRDGAPDLAFVPRTSSTLKIYLNDGSGAFTEDTSQSAPPMVTDAEDILAADLDGDGDEDLLLGDVAAGGTWGARVVRNDGGDFSTVVHTIAGQPAGNGGAAAGDIDLDGDLDLVLSLVGSRTAVFWNDGTGVFTEGPQLIGVMDRPAIILDADGDGDFDVFGCGGANSSKLFFNDRTGWRPLSGTGAPSARAVHTAVWTGDEMIIWGGHQPTAAGGGNIISPQSTGGIYDPKTDAWRPVATANAPSARLHHVAVWTGSEMIVWGGVSGQGGPWRSDGARYDPASGAWTTLETANAPSERYLHSAVWTGTDMIVWGGRREPDDLDTGARYRPGVGWTAMSTTGAPSGRARPAMVWTGSEVLVWGGHDGVSSLGDGAAYDPVMDTWRAISGAGAPSARTPAASEWTGTHLLVWGGSGAAGPLSDGGLYDPVAGSWTPILATSVPVARTSSYGTGAVWTGSHLMVWGGVDGTPSGYLDDGAIFDPVTAIWQPLSASDAPSARYRGTIVWTGQEAIQWGGRDGDAQGDGARYRPSAGPGLCLVAGCAKCGAGETRIERSGHCFCIDTHEASRPDATSSFAGNLGSFPVSLPAALPAGSVTWKQAAQACLRAGKRLCTAEEHLEACGGPSGFTYPYGNGYQPGRCNLCESAPCASVPLQPTAESNMCSSADGVHDLTGNAGEWVADRAGLAQGGSREHDTSTEYRQCGYQRVFGATAASYDHGYRCCRSASSSAVAQRVVVIDDFERSDGSTIGNGWTPHSRTWALLGGEAKLTGNGSSRWGTMSKDIGWQATFDLQVTFRSNGGEAYMTVNAEGGPYNNDHWFQDGLIVLVGAGNVRLTRQEGGANNNVAMQPFTLVAGRDYHLRSKFDGTTFSAWVWEVGTTMPVSPTTSAMTSNITGAQQTDVVLGADHPVELYFDDLIDLSR